MAEQLAPSKALTELQTGHSEVQYLAVGGRDRETCLEGLCILLHDECLCLCAKGLLCRGVVLLVFMQHHCHLGVFIFVHAIFVDAFLACYGTHPGIGSGFSLCHLLVLILLLFLLGMSRSM